MPIHLVQSGHIAWLAIECFRHDIVESHVNFDDGFHIGVWFLFKRMTEKAKALSVKKEKKNEITYVDSSRFHSIDCRHTGVICVGF
jgi:hypothetical protein